MELSIPYLHFEVPSLVTRISSDVNAVRMVVLLLYREGLKAPLTIIIAAVFMAVTNLKLALIVLSAARGLSLTIIIIRIAVPYFIKMQKATDDVNRVIEEDVKATREVKAFVRELHEEQKFDSVNETLKDVALKANRIVSLNMPIILSALNMATALVIYFGGTVLSAMSLMAFNMISNLIMNFSIATASSERITEICDEKIDIESDLKEGNFDFDPSRIEDGVIKFQETGFSYFEDAHQLAFGPASFKVTRGEVMTVNFKASADTQNC